MLLEKCLSTIFSGYSVVQLVDAIDNNWHRYWLAFRRALLGTICIVAALWGYISHGCK